MDHLALAVKQETASATLHAIEADGTVTAVSTSSSVVTRQSADRTRSWKEYRYADDEEDGNPPAYTGRLSDVLGRHR